MTNSLNYSYQPSLFDNQYDFSSRLDRDFNSIKNSLSKIKTKTKKKIKQWKNKG